MKQNWQKIVIQFKKMTSRWMASDHPTTEQRFQLILFFKDVAIFLGIPLISIILFHSCEGCGTKPKHPPKDQKRADSYRYDTSKSQIISFQPSGGGSPLSGIQKRAPGV